MPHYCLLNSKILIWQINHWLLLLPFILSSDSFCDSTTEQTSDEN